MVEKRIVFEHTNGPFAGLREIMGTASQLSTEAPGTLPDHAEGFEARGRVIEFASLVEVRRTCAVYRETRTDSEGKHYPQRVR